jgi:archaellum component FlaC
MVAQDIYQAIEQLKSTFKDIMKEYSIYFEVDNKVDRFTSKNFSIEIDEDGDIKIKINNNN